MEKITLTKKRLIPVLFFLLFTAIGFAQSQTFNSSGTFNVPAGVTSVTVEAWGAGGHGGTRLGANGRGGGGGGGAYAMKVISVTPGAVIPVNVGVSGTSTTAGGASWFVDNTTVMAV
ncbi:MAG TPA: hypothetical protein VK623_00125, partial [Flavobacterium sp.]|nr:hypothetical protein [Flavobacterium sp.]